MMNEIKTYSEFISHFTFRDKLRKQARKTLIAALSVRHRIQATSNWIRLIFYHHVFDDERKGFERQLKYLKNFGEFISLDQVCNLVEGTEHIDGRYFSLSFDDGFYNTYTNMMPITANLGIPVIIYLPTNFIDSVESLDYPTGQMREFSSNDSIRMTFLNWDNCKEMLHNNITFGSHTAGHMLLSKLSEIEIERELTVSKKLIEEKLQTPCDHFACPSGRIGIDFDPEITSEIAQKVGFKSVVSVERGKVVKGDNLYLLPREHLVPGWENFQLKYFIGKE